MKIIFIKFFILFFPPIFPDAASAEAANVDTLFFFMVAVCGSTALLVCGLLAFFAIKYRRREAGQRASNWKTPRWLEIVWIVVPTLVFLVMFYWGATLYFNVVESPENALEINVIAKQWMWKFQHPGSQRELNELHIPVNQPIKITVASQDVIHSFFVPAFRLHFDVVPGRYRTTWFKPTEIGTFQLECSQYCGTNHSQMIGKIIVMSAEDYQNWLSLGADESIASKGQNLFRQLGCNACHTGDAAARAPMLTNLYGNMARLENGETIKVDEEYIRESILNPQAKIVSGYKPIMPTFQGQLDEEQLLQLVAYIKSLSAGREQIPPNFAPGAPQPAPVEDAIRKSENNGNMGNKKENVTTDLHR